MARIDTDDLISIANASRLGVSALAREAEQGRERVLLRNNTPVAAIVGIERFEGLQRAEDDLLDLSLVAARMMLTGPERHSLDEILDQFGYSRDELRDLAE